MASEGFQEFSGAVPETDIQCQWYLAIDKLIDLEIWQQQVRSPDSVIVGTLKSVGELIPAIGLGVTTHTALNAHLRSLALQGIEVIDPFHMQIHIDEKQQLSFLNVACGYDFELEKFAQKLTKLLPQEVTGGRKVLLQASALGGKLCSWYKYLGEDLITEIHYEDFRGTVLEGEYISIKPMKNLSGATTYHATRIIADFPSNAED